MPTDCLPDSRPEQLRTPKSCRGKKGLSTAFCSGPSKEVGRPGGPRQRLREISHLGHATPVDSGGFAVSKKAATTAAVLAQVLPMPALLLALLSSKKSIFLCPPSFPLSLYPTLSSLAELRLSLDMTADKGDGQRRRAILLGTDGGRAEIVQCQSRKKVFSGESEEAVSRLLGCFAHAAEEDKGLSRWDDARDECECREVGGHSVRM